MRRRFKEFDSLYELASRWVDVALRSDGSLFTPEKAIWTLTNVEELFARTAGNPQTTKEDFDTKFKHQLEGAGPDVYQLAAEEVTVYWIVSSAAGGKAKRELVDAIIAWSPAPAPIPKDIAATFEEGLVHPGIAYHVRKPMQLWFLLDFVRTFKKLPEEQRSRILQEPWALRQLLFSLDPRSAQTMREALLHLIHPQAFEAITSLQDRLERAV